MTKFITLTCPSCGTNHLIADDIDRFTCTHCGKEHTVNRNGGTFTLNPIGDGIARAHNGVDKTAVILAIARIKDEIMQLGNPINYSEAALEILNNPSRKTAFMKAYKYIKGAQLSVIKKAQEKNTIKEFQQIFSTLKFDDLVKLNAYFASRHITDDERIVSYILRKIINTSIREGKLKELARYQEILRDQN